MKLKFFNWLLKKPQLRDTDVDKYYGAWVYYAKNQKPGDPESKNRPWGLEYKLDPVIAQRIYDMYVGQKGLRQHSYRAISRSVIGYECQKSGEDLLRFAYWTLGREW